MNMQKSITNPDDGSWLSAQQAVLPDGTEVGNLPLINKKLPQLYTPGEPQVEAQTAESHGTVGEAIKAIEFAVAINDGLDFLVVWLQRDFQAIRQKWPDAPIE